MGAGGAWAKGRPVVGCWAGRGSTGPVEDRGACSGCSSAAPEWARAHTMVNSVENPHKIVNSLQKFEGVRVASISVVRAGDCDFGPVLNNFGSGWVITSQGLRHKNNYGHFSSNICFHNVGQQDPRPTMRDRPSEISYRRHTAPARQNKFGSKAKDLPFSFIKKV
ncbi:hypothetical protein VPH35_096580 [Triticum aestivum]